MLRVVPFLVSLTNSMQNRHTETMKTDAVLSHASYSTNVSAADEETELLKEIDPTQKKDKIDVLLDRVRALGRGKGVAHERESLGFRL